MVFDSVSRCLLVLVLSTGLLACEKGPDENLLPPTILDFYEPADTIGAVVRIVGTQFSKKPENNTVSFNGQAATAFTLRGDTLKVRVPRGATTGPLTLRVYNQNTVSAMPFRVLLGRWRHRNALPPSPSQANGFALNGKAYLYTQGSSDGFYSYDPSSNAWRRLPDFPGGARGGMLSFALGGIGYIGAGISNNGLNSHTDCHAYDPATNQWTRVADFPGGNLDVRYTKAFAAGGKGYVVCTTWFNGQHPVWEYDPRTNTWMLKRDFPGVDRYLAGGMGIGNKGYVGGGTTGGTPLLNDFWEYDPTTDAWTRKADLPEVTESPVSYALGNKGYWGLRYQRGFYEYDPAQNTWALTAYYPGGKAFLGSAFTAGNKGYLLVPDIDGITHLKTDLWEFTP